MSGHGGQGSGVRANSTSQVTCVVHDIAPWQLGIRLALQVSVPSFLFLLLPSLFTLLLELFLLVNHVVLR